MPSQPVAQPGVVRAGAEVGAATFVVADARPDEGASLGRGLAPNSSSTSSAPCCSCIHRRREALERVRRRRPSKIVRRHSRQRDSRRRASYVRPRALGDPQVLPIRAIYTGKSRGRAQGRPKGYKDTLLISGAAHIGLDQVIKAMTDRLFGPDGLNGARKIAALGRKSS